MAEAVYSIMPFLDIPLWLLLAYFIGFGIVAKGLRHMLAIVATWGTTVAAALFFTKSVTVNRAYASALALLLGGVLGAASAWLLKSDFPANNRNRSVTMSILSRIGKNVSTSWRSRFLYDSRFRVIVSSVVVAVVFGYFIRQFAIAEQPDGRFWAGVYEAWVASLLFFLIIGVATLVVTLLKPEEEDFNKRVLILCGGRNGSAFHYVGHTIKSIGFLSTKIARTYIIEGYQPNDNAIEVRVRHESTHENFCDDVGIYPGGLKLVPDPRLTSIDPIGQLSHVKVNGEEIIHAEAIPTGKVFQKEWSIEIPRNKTTLYELEHRVWCDLAEPMVYRTRHFAEELAVTLHNGLAHVDFQAQVEITHRNQSGEFEFSNPHKLVSTHILQVASPINLPAIMNCFPNEVVLTIKLSVKPRLPPTAPVVQSLPP